MKKLTTFLLCLSLALTAALPAAAGEVPAMQTGTGTTAIGMPNPFTDCKDAQDAEEALPKEAPEPEKPAKSPNKDSNSQEWKYQVRRCLGNLRIETDHAAWKAALASAKNLQHYLELLVREDNE